MENIKETICDLLLSRAQQFPDLNAIGSIERKKVQFISFKSYKEFIECYSIAFIYLGVKSQTKVSIISSSRKEWNFIDMAIMCSGAVTIPIYPSYTPSEIEFILNHSDSEYLVIEGQEEFDKVLKIQNKIPHIKKIITFDQIKITAQSKLNENIELLSLDKFYHLGNLEVQNNPDQFQLTIERIAPDSLATIVYTSGTTGEPKGAMIKHQALFQVLKNIKKYTKNSVYHQDRFLTYLPLSHVLGRLESFFPILFACEAVYAGNAQKIIDNITIIQPSFLVAVPRILEKIYDKAMAEINANELKKVLFNLATNTANQYYETIENDKTPDTKIILEYQLAKKIIFNNIYRMFGGNIRYFISGGAPLNHKINEFLRNAGLTVLEGYGLTETMAPCCINPMNKQVLGSVGKPIGDVEINFGPDQEIFIRSKALFHHYYKDPETTQSVLTEDGWFATGDIGEFNPNGFLKITDRKRDIIITSGGKNIAPQKIENMLKLRPYISQAMVIGDQRKFLTALIGVEFESFLEKLKEFEISRSVPLRDLINQPQICQLIQDDVNQVNQDLAKFEQICDFRIISTEMTTDNYLTPSLKLKKKLLLQDFKCLINSMYKGL